MKDERTGEKWKLAPLHKEIHAHMDVQTRLLLEAPREHGKCLATGTKIQALDGALTPIEQWQGGMLAVLNLDTLKIEGGETKAATSAGMKECYEVILRNGRRITASEEHPFLRGIKWVELKELQIGDRICEIDKSKDLKAVAESDVAWDEIINVQPKGSMETWDIEVPTHHNFIAEGIVVHNSGTVVSRILYELGRNPNLLIKLICSSDDMAKKRLMAVTQYIESDKDMHAVFPDLQPAKKASWTKRAIYVDRNVISGEPSVEAYGITSSSTGSRADLLIFEDVCDMRNTIVNPALQDTVKAALHENCMNFLPADGGRAWYICTPWSANDVSQELKSMAAWHHLRRPVTVDRPIWPERWGSAQLQRRKDELPLRAWQRQFELILIAKEGATFPHESLTMASEDNLFVEPEGTRYYAGVDLALSDIGNYFVICVGARTPDGKSHLVETRRKRGVTFRNQVIALVNIHEKYGLDLAMVEQNAYQKAMVQELEGKIPVKGYTTNATSKRDEVIGIPGFASEIESGMWTFWDASGSNKRVIEELMAYPHGDKDDCVMAAFFLREAMRKNAARGPQIPIIVSPHFRRAIQPKFKTSPYVRPML